MGISGLLPLLKSIQRPSHVRSWAGKTVGIDAYGWLHKGTISCAIDLALGKPTSKYVDYVMGKVKMLKYFGVTPYLIFDGDYLPSKEGTERDREKKRAAAKTAGLEMLKLGRTGMAHLELQKAVDVTPTMARHVMDACAKESVQCLVAPYEADSQLYYLEKTGVIDAVISEDSDMLVFGVRCLLTKLDQYGECIELNRAQFTACKEVSLAGWTDQEFRVMCILSGCDYLDNIPKMGLKTAHRLVRRHKTVERVIKSVQLDGTMTVPKGYLEAFERADLTFKHQRVFCPAKQEMVMCNDPESPLDDECKVYIGPHLPVETACAVARGELDPMTKQPIVIRAGRNFECTKTFSFTPLRPDMSMAAPPKNNKAITSFFKPKDTPPPRTPLTCKTNLPPPHSAPATSIVTPSKSCSTTTPVVANKRALPRTETANKRTCVTPASQTTRQFQGTPIQPRQVPTTPNPKAVSVQTTPAPAEPQEEEEEEESPFFANKRTSRRSVPKRVPKPSFAAKAAVPSPSFAPTSSELKETPFYPPIVAPRAEPLESEEYLSPQNLDSPASPHSAAELANAHKQSTTTTITTTTPSPAPSPEVEPESAAALAASRKRSLRSSTDTSDLNLSTAFAYKAPRVSVSGIPKRPTPLQRMGALATSGLKRPNQPNFKPPVPTGTQRRNFTAPILKPAGRPFATDSDDSGESQDRDDDEPFGMGQWSANTSMNSSESNSQVGAGGGRYIDTDDVKGVFDQFVYGKRGFG